MRARLTFTLLSFAALIAGCQHRAPSLQEAPAVVLGTADLERQVGRRIVLEGVVTNTKCPQIQGVDVWGLENFRGEQVRVSGILRKSVVTEAEIVPTIANRGAGTFYSLDEMEYGLIK